MVATLTYHAEHIAEVLGCFVWVADAVGGDRPAARANLSRALARY